MLEAFSTWDQSISSLLDATNPSRFRQFSLHAAHGTGLTVQLAAYTCPACSAQSTFCNRFDGFPGVLLSPDVSKRHRHILVRRSDDSETFSHGGTVIYYCISLSEYQHPCSECLV